jgi:asparagine synthase (glutamine-hydrolysing)
MGERIEAWVTSSKATTFRRGQSLLAARAPSTLTVSGDVGMASSGALTCHPRAECRADGEVRLEAGVLPQYPLYYALPANGDRLVACSRLAPLASLLPDAAICARRLVSLLSWPSELDSESTAYAGIKRLRPCESIVAAGDAVRIDRVFPRVAGRYRVGRPRDFAMELREQLNAAVERSIGSSNRVAVFVSGGLDSSGVLALASSRAPRELCAISVQYAAPGDDRPYFAELERALTAETSVLSARDAGEWFRSSLCADAQPVVLGTTCLDMLQCATAIAWRADVSLSGVNGDRVCGGTLPYAQLARRGHLVDAVRGALGIRLPWRMSSRSRLRLVFGPLVPRWALPSIWWPARKQSHGPPPWMRGCAGELFLDIQETGASRSRSLPDTPDAWMVDLCTHDFLPDTADLGGQVASVTGCFPMDVFLDPEFVRFMLELDPQILSLGGEYRGLYRLAMKGTIPEKIRKRQDKARFEPAMAAAAAASGCLDELRDLASFEALASRGLVEPSLLRAGFNEWLAVVAQGERTWSLPPDARWQRMWALLAVEAFLREHGRGRELR